jgi:hypothetical protein
MAAALFDFFIEFLLNFLVERGLAGGELVTRLISCVVIAVLTLSGCTAAATPENSAPEPPEVSAFQVERSESEPVDSSSEDTSQTEVGAPFTESWPAGFKRVDSIATAKVESMAFFEKRRPQSCPTTNTVFFEHKANNIDDFEIVIDAYMSVMCDYFDKDIFIAIGSYEFAKDKLQNTEAFLDEFGGVCGIPQPGVNTGCALNNTVWVLQNPTSDEDFVLFVLTHELFHVLQDSTQTDVTPTWRTPPTSELFVPSWFIEGSANFFLGMFLEYLEIADYEDVIDGPPSLLMGRDSPPGLALLEQGWADSVYQNGQFGAEYLVANAGFEVLLEAFLLRNQGVGFNQALINLTGLSKEDFYALVDTADLANG